MDEIVFIPLQPPKYRWLIMAYTNKNNKHKSKLIQQSMDEDITEIGVAKSIIEKIKNNFISYDTLELLCSKLEIKKDFAELILNYTGEL